MPFYQGIVSKKNKITDALFSNQLTKFMRYVLLVTLNLVFVQNYAVMKHLEV